MAATQILIELKVDSRGAVRGVKTAKTELNGLQTQAEAAGGSVNKLAARIARIESELQSGGLSTLKATTAATKDLTTAFRSAASAEDRERFAALRVEVARVERALLADGAAFDEYRARATRAAQVSREEFLRFRTVIRRVTRETRRDVVQVGQDLARGIIDRPTAEAQLEAIEGRYERFVGRVRALSRDAATDTRRIGRELGAGSRLIRREIAQTDRRANGLTAQVRRSANASVDEAAAGSQLATDPASIGGSISAEGS
ncbi:MAG: hypothetical protein AAFP15_17215, partial [Bacteroidota bacterium]